MSFRSVRDGRRLAGATLLETITACAILALLIGAIGFAIGPTAREARTKTTCATNMRQIVTAVRLYMSDHDEANSAVGAWNPQIAPYLNTKLNELYCPKALGFGGSKFDPYIDEITHNIALKSSEANPNRDLAGGIRAPSFDVEQDALLKCKMHGDGAYREPQTIAVVLDSNTLHGNVLSAYLDGHLSYAPLIACWELPYLADQPPFRNYPLLMRHCDGSLGTHQ